MAMKIIIGLLVAAGIGGGVWYVSMNSTSSPEAPSEETSSETQEGTFADLMARQGSWKCTASATHDYGASEGVVYMDRGSLRGDFVASMSGQTVNTSFISRDGYMYTWSGLLPQGFKVKIDEAAGTAGGEGIDPSTPVKYSCEVWIAESSRFEIPSDIEFYDVNAQGGAVMPSIQY